MKIETIADYGTHQYTHKWTKTDYYCPHCGIKDKVWENDSYDYYVGNDKICIECGYIFTIEDSKIEDKIELQSLEQLRKSIENK